MSATERRWNRFTRYLERREADVTDLQDAPIGWRGGVVLTWAGMRGVVTLAAAQSLPRGTPYRSPLILIAFTVAIVTLLVQGGTLPVGDPAARRHGLGCRGGPARTRRTPRGDEQGGPRRHRASRRDVAGAARTYDPEVVERVREDTMLRVEAQWERAEREASDDAGLGPHQQYQALAGAGPRGRARAPCWMRGAAAATRRAS